MCVFAVLLEIAELVLDERRVMALRKKEHNPRSRAAREDNDRQLPRIGHGSGPFAPATPPRHPAVSPEVLRIPGSGRLLCSGIFLVQRGDVLFQGFRSLIHAYSFSWGGDNRLHFALARGQHVSEDERKQNE